MADRDNTKSRFGIFRFPERAVLSQTAWLFFGGLVSVGIVAVLTGVAFSSTERPPLAPFTLIAALFFVPSLGEEMIFRGLLHPARNAEYRRLRIFGAGALFVAWHPLQYWLGIGPDGSALFVTLPFILTVGILAYALGLLREVSGSIWPPALLHWVVVCTWKV